MHIPLELVQFMDSYGRLDWVDGRTESRLARGKDLKLQGNLYVRGMSDELAVVAKHTRLGRLEATKLGRWTWRVRGRELDALFSEVVGRLEHMRELVELYLATREQVLAYGEHRGGRPMDPGLRAERQRLILAAREELDGLRKQLYHKAGHWKKQAMPSGERKAQRRRQQRRKRWT